MLKTKEHNYVKYNRKRGLINKGNICPVLYFNRKFMKTAIGSKIYIGWCDNSAGILIINWEGFAKKKKGLSRFSPQKKAQDEES
jgi:hypothetical protein